MKHGLACPACDHVDERVASLSVCARVCECFIGMVSGQITDLASDAVECSKLARTVALRLTDGIADGNIAMSYDSGSISKYGASGADWGTGDIMFEVCESSFRSQGTMKAFS